MASPEKFDFTKKEDLNRFKNLGVEEREAVIDAARAEAGRMRWEVENGYAENYEGAAEIVGMENRIKDIRLEGVQELKTRIKELVAQWEGEKKKWVLQSLKKGEGGFSAEDTWVSSGEEHYLDPDTGKKYTKRSNAYEANREVSQLRDKLHSLGGNLDWESYGYRGTLAAQLNLLTEKGQGELAEKWSDNLLTHEEKYVQKAEYVYRDEHLKESVEEQLMGVVKASDPNTVTDKAARLLSVVKKTAEKPNHGDERRGSEQAALVADHIMEFVMAKAPSIPDEKKKQLVDKALNDLQSVFSENRDGIESAEVGRDAEKDSRNQLARLVASIDSNDGRYKADALQEWNEKFSTALMPLEAVAAYLKSAEKNPEQKKALITDILKRADERIEKIETMFREIHPDGIGHNYILGVLTTAAEAGIEFADYDDRIKRLVEVAKRSDKATFNMQRYRDRVLAEIEVGDGKVKSLLNKTREELGAGFKTEGAEYSGGTRIYLDGKFVAVAEGASQFSNQPSNNEIIAWVSRELIDYDRVVKGPQWRDNVFAWKKGWETPKRIYEDHAYEYERHFRIRPPVVTEDGKIEIEVDSEGKSDKKVLTLKDES